MAAKFNLDKLDLQIIHEMMETAEISYAELGKKLFVSGGTIHVRIKKLQEFGIVKGTKLNVDIKQLGYDITAFVGIYLEKSSLYDNVAAELMNIPEIVRLNYITGNYSMFIEIVCKDITAFVGIYLEKSSLYDNVAAELMNIPEIVRLNYITGNYSMFIEIVCKDITELRYVLHDALQKIKGIDRTETFISLEEGFNRNVQVAPIEENNSI